MNYFYHPGLDQSTTQFSFSREESRHIAKVLRKKDGDVLHITNGDSTVDIMRKAGVGGEIVPWRDVLQMLNEQWKVIGIDAPIKEGVDHTIGLDPQAQVDPIGRQGLEKSRKVQPG